MRKFNNVWITSDTHFFHKNIIEYEDRPFKDYSEMNETLIKNWNKVVGKDDLVYHLGDLYLCGSKTDVTNILNRLNGHIIIICGNHDKDYENFYRKSGRFLEVISYGHQLIIDKWIILSHEPVYLEQSSPYVNLFGHVHGSKVFKTISSQGACVCVERWNYTPVNINTVKELIGNERTSKETIESNTIDSIDNSNSTISDSNR